VFKPVIPAWMPESSHMDVKLSASTSPQSSTCKVAKLPSMALDSGIHAGMTTFFGSTELMYYDER
jgi:hypothetical protein